MYPIPKARPLEDFLDALAQHAEVRELLLKSGKTIAEFHDSGGLHDLVHDDSYEISEIDAWGGDENHYQIRIQEFGSVFWIQAKEFDDIGYFASLAEAEAHARDAYQTDIEAAEEFAESEEDDDEDDE